MKFLYYEGRTLARYPDLPGIKRFLPYFQIYGHILAPPVDRSGVIKFPVRTKSIFRLPEMRAFTENYEQVCNARARELIAQAEKLDLQLYAFWSGGVDSTCLLVSLLKQASPAQRQRILVLLTEESIREYPLFYEKFIRGKLRRNSAMMLPYILGSRALLVNGEHNDQLFGSDIVPAMSQLFGLHVLHEPYNRALFVAFLTKLMKDANLALFYVRLFEQLAGRAPIPLKTNFERFWWINFTLKWQTVYMRVLSFVAERNVKLLSKEYIENCYASFYNTENFQLWSLNNRDKRIANGWRSYKWPAKQVIYEFTKDADYRDNKMKRGSLQYVIARRVPFEFVDENFNFRQNVAAEEFYQEDNSFV